MLLRTLWCRLGARRPLSSACCLHPNLTNQEHTTAGWGEPGGEPPPPPQTSTVPPATWSPPPWGSLSGPCCLLDTHGRAAVLQIAHHIAASRQTPRPSSSVWLSSSSMFRSQMRHYSTNLVKPVLKSTLKVPVVPGKRIPKGPRTKQPSRTNQPLQEESQVHQKTTEFLT